MKTKELIEYLREFDEDSEVAVIAANPKARKKYTGGMFGITDMGLPVLCFNIEAEEDMDEEEKETTEECEQEANEE